MKLLDYKKPDSLEEAFDLYEKEDSEIIGGGAWLKLGNHKRSLGIDLDNLGLNKIEELEDGIHIGAMTTLYQMEESVLLQNVYDGIISKSCSKIMGVPVRNIATLGGTVCGKYGFSDLITPLLAIGVKLRFFKNGLMSLEDFLDRKGKYKDILTEVIIPKNDGKGYFETFKKTSLDFALINVAVTELDSVVKVAVGARPGVAKLRTADKEELKRLHQEGTSYHDLAVTLTQDIKFGANQRSGKEYRVQLATVLTADGLKEVLS